jgi:hypothetical protein
MKLVIMENKKTDSVVKDVERYFSFLHGKGFEIRSAEYSSQHFGNWVIAFESSTCVIFITSDRSQILLEFSAKKDLNVKNRKTIEEIIYSISNGKVIVESFRGNLAWGKKKQLERLSNLLVKYIDEIIPCFDNEIGKFLIPN